MDSSESAELPSEAEAARGRPSAAIACLLGEARRHAVGGDAAGARELFQAALALDLECEAAAAGVIATAGLDLSPDLPVEPVLPKALERMRREVFGAADETAILALDAAAAVLGPERYEILAQLHLWRGDRRRAQTWLQRQWLLSLGQSADPLLNEASYELLREYLLAINAMQGVSKTGKAKQMARLHLARGDIDAARKHLANVVRENVSAEVLAALAALDNARGDYGPALRKISAALPLTADRARLHEWKAAAKRAIQLGLRGVPSRMPPAAAALNVMTSPFDRHRLMGWKFLRHFHRAERPDLIRSTVFQRVERSQGWVFPVTLGESRKLSPDKSRDTADYCVFDCIPELVLKRVRQGKGHILIDHGHEALFAHKDSSRNHFAEMLGHLKSQDIPPERLIILDGNLKAAPAGEAIAARVGMAAPRILPNRYLWFQLSAAHRALRRAAGGVDIHVLEALERIAKRTPRPKRFLSYNGVARPQRWALTAWLHDQELLEKGLVSFKGPPGWGGNSPQQLAEALPQVNSLVSLQSPGETLKALQLRGPLAVDDAYALDPQVRWSLAYGRNPSWPYLDTYFSVVTETVFSNGRSSVSTEKLMKPVANLHPFLLIGDPGTLKDLRARGFETFGQWFDERYDEIADPPARMAAALAEVKRLALLSDAEWAEMAGQMQPLLLHNYYAFLELAPRMAEEIVGQIREAIQAPA